MFTDLWFVVFSLLILVGLIQDVPVLTLVGALAVLTGGVAWAWGRLSLERVSYQRALSQDRAFVGDEVVLTLTVTNRKPLPLPRLVIEEQFPAGLELAAGDLESGGQEGVFRLTSRAAVAWYERVRWRYQIRCGRRGVYRLGPTRLRASDLFGLFQREQSLPEMSTLLVYPKSYPLEMLGLPYRHPLGTLRGKNPLFQDMTRPAGVREYQQGDPWKQVDWKATARSGKLQVRLLDPFAAEMLVVALNLDTVEEPWMGFVPHVLERGVTVAASVAQDGLERRVPVGLVSNGAHMSARKPLFIEPSRRPSQLVDILETLAMAGPMTIRPLEEVLLSAGPRLPTGATMVVVTSLLGPGLTQALQDLLRRGHAVVALWTGDQAPPLFPEGVETHRVVVSSEDGGGVGIVD